MGRAKGAENGKNAAAGSSNGAGRRGDQSPMERRLVELGRQVMPLHMRFSVAGAGKDSQEEQNAAKARAVRALPVATQLDLIRGAQEATGLVEEGARSAGCPECGVAAGESCVKDSGNPRLAHPGRIEDALRGMDRRDATNMARAVDLNNKAREVFIYSHTGYVMQQMRKQVATFESEDSASALQVLSQEARLGLNDAVTDYKFFIPKKDAEGNVLTDPATGEPVLVANEANPLTYAVGKIRNRVSEAKDQGRLIALKSRAADAAEKVEKAMKQVSNRGDRVTLAEVAELTGLPEAKCAEYMRSLNPKSRLDAPMSSDAEGEDTLGTVIADDSTSVSGSVLGEMERDIIRDEVAKLPPFQRRIVEAQFQLSGGEDIEVKDLYDGVYRDPKTGEMFSSEGPVISLRKKRDGVEVAKASQRELTQRFEAGELEFEAGTPESFELARLKLAEDLEKKGKELPEVSREDMVRRVITAETGVPMVSHKVLEAKDAAMYALSQRKELEGLRPRYRGNHELENSLEARKMVRHALVVMGDVSAVEAEGTKAGRAAKDGSHQRGKLGQLAEERNWLDPATGRVNWAKLRDDVHAHKVQAARAAREAELESTEELADLMSQA